MPEPGDLAIQRNAVGAGVELVVDSPGAGHGLRALQPGGTMPLVGRGPSNRPLAYSAPVSLARRRQGVQCSSTDYFRHARSPNRHASISTDWPKFIRRQKPRHSLRPLRTDKLPR
jgi:hypothetical protein